MRDTKPKMLWGNHAKQQVLAARETRFPNTSTGSVQRDAAASSHSESGTICKQVSARQLLTL